MAILRDLNRDLGVMVSKLALALDQHTVIRSTRQSPMSAVSDLVRDLQTSKRKIADLTQLNICQQQIITSQKYLIMLQTQEIAGAHSTIRGFCQQDRS